MHPQEGRALATSRLDPPTQNLTKMVTCILGMEEETRMALQDQLVDVIMRVLVANPELHYYQVKLSAKKTFSNVNTEVFNTCPLIIHDTSYVIDISQL